MVIMKEFTIEEKASRYDEAIKRAKDSFNYPSYPGFIRADVVFPELKKDIEDEKIREALIDYFDDADKADENPLQSYGIHTDKAIAWLEKQGEKPQGKSALEAIKEEKVDNRNYIKPIDKSEPKFKVGDWIISKYMHLVMQILNNDNGSYKTVETDGTERNDSYDFIERNFKFWTIQDAKKGDILQANKCTLIFDSLTKDIDNKTAISSWYFCDSKRFYGIGTSEPDLWDIEGVVPATKEQCDILFQKMKESGYVWDFDTKELNKIHVIDEGKAEMDYCFTKMMNGERVSSAWSEGDERTYKSVLYAFEHNYPLNSEQQRFIKSLKDKVQPKQWSEEDEAKLKSACAFIRNTSLNGNEDVVNSTIDWLKSLKLRNHWKPTEEQVSTMKYLAKYYAKGCDEPTRSIIEGLYEQLKQL